VIASLTSVVVGVVVGGAIWMAVREVFDAGVFARTNHRGAPVLTSVGIVIPITVTLLAGFLRVMQLLTQRAPGWDQLVGPTVTAALGFGLFGLLDDLAGTGQSGGFRGHLGALARGRVTTGALKLLGGGAVALLTSAALARGDEGLVGALRDAAIVALAANAANLLDRRPGRTTKVAGAAFLGLALWSGSPTLVGPGVGVGAAIALLPSEFRERIMLGDAGANALGALVGLATLAALPTATARWVVLSLLLALNLMSVVVSFSSVIDAVPPLRYLDRLGRRTEPED
jgi:UDP-N-acetylmuramyl pentapeptide phosphotransferase/UDP-N-acetylglucosamine-1-phosphate transferase